MGAHPWYYFVPYQSDIDQALQELRTREFAAGRYNPATPLPFGPASLRILTALLLPHPRIKHSTIEEALADAGADGSRSILDMHRISSEPTIGTVTAVPGDSLRELYGTVQPTRAMIERNMGIWELNRGEGAYIVIYKDGKPSEIFFGGYSYD